MPPPGCARRPSGRAADGLPPRRPLKRTHFPIAESGPFHCGMRIADCGMGHGPGGLSLRIAECVLRQAQHVLSSRRTDCGMRNSRAALHLAPFERPRPKRVFQHPARRWPPSDRGAWEENVPPCDGTPRGRTASLHTRGTPPARALAPWRSSRERSPPRSRSAGGSAGSHTLDIAEWPPSAPSPVAAQAKECRPTH